MSRPERYRPREGGDILEGAVHLFEYLDHVIDLLEDRCDHLMKDWDDVLLTSYPAQRRWTCKTCGKRGVSWASEAAIKPGKE